MSSAEIARELEGRISGELRFDAVSRALYSTDASVYQIEPLGVALPRTQDELLEIVRACARARCPLTMRGGGTSQAGQAIGEGLVADTSKYLIRLLEVNAAERWARVEPGIVLDELNAQLRPHGLRFAPDISTASRATIGGMMANNSSGARSVLYGKTIDHVLEQRVVLSDGSLAQFRDLDGAELERACAGDSLEAACYRAVRSIAGECGDEVRRRFPRVLRRVMGYNLDEFLDSSKPFNLAKLMVGSEGTLGVVLEAKIRLTPLPAAKAVLAIEFADLLEALAATPLILRHGPSAVEVMDKFILDNTRQNPALEELRRSVIEGDPGALLCVEMYAERQEELPPRLGALEAELRANRLGYRYSHATGAADQARIWALREAALGLSMAMKDDAKSLSFVEDTAVPPERLRDYIERFLAIVKKHGSSAGVYAHASVGCLHVRPVVNLKTEEGVRKFESIANEVADLVLEFGGALSGEHGDGLVRSPFIEKMFGSEIYAAFRRIKKTFDPHGIFNPGKIVDAPPITSNLRYGASYKTPAPFTFFEYKEHGGLGKAVEMCSGLGACRKKLDGTMCPSYMATSEEAHSTRGRANVLRLAMTGRLGEAGLTSEGVYEVLDLCLECRACKAECPVGVDVARFKSEFLAAHWERHGVPRQARMLGNARAAAEWGSRLAPVANFVAATGFAKACNERWFGIDRRRELPAWRSRTFLDWASRRREASANALIFPDTFTNFYDPEIGIAAAETLDAAGIRNAVAPGVCCGRPLISKGLLRQAATVAERGVRALHPLARDGKSFLFCEPSCLSSFKEDVPDLLRGELQQQAQAVAGACFLFEDYLEREIKAGRAQLNLKKGPENVLLHGHCHQKSMGLLAPAKALLGRAPGVRVIDPDAGCCGMAGSFGYSRDHYDISRAIAERKLVPAVRGLPAGSAVCASGTSCRHQLHDFAGVRAMHPAVFLRSLTAQ